MARVKRAVNSRKNHKKVLKLAKGYYGGKSRLFKTANETDPAEGAGRSSPGRLLPCPHRRRAL